MTNLEYTAFTFAIFMCSGLLLFCIKHGEEIKTAFGG